MKIDDTCFFKLLVVLMIPCLIITINCYLKSKKDVDYYKTIKDNSLNYRQLQVYKKQLDGNKVDIKNVYEELINKYGQNNKITSVNFYTGKIESINRKTEKTQVEYVDDLGEKSSIDIDSTDLFPKYLSNEELINKKIELIEIFCCVDEGLGFHYLFKIS